MGSSVSVNREDILHEQLIYYSRYGFIDKLNYLYLDNPQIDLSRNDEEAFRIACNSGEIYVIRQLREWNPAMDLSARDYEGFRLAVLNGHKEVISHILAWDYLINPLDFLQYALAESTIELLQSLHLKRSRMRWFRELKDNTNSQIECSVCFEIPLHVIVSPCKHIYCQKCIEKWFAISPTCPYCRKDF